MGKDDLVTKSHNDLYLGQISIEQQSLLSSPAGSVVLRAARAHSWKLPSPQALPPLFFSGPLNKEAQAAQASAASTPGQLSKSTRSSSGSSRLLKSVCFCMWWGEERFLLWWSDWLTQKVEKMRKQADWQNPKTSTCSCEKSELHLVLKKREKCVTFAHFHLPYGARGLVLVQLEKSVTEIQEETHLWKRKSKSSFSIFHTLSVNENSWFLSAWLNLLPPSRSLFIYFPFVAKRPTGNWLTWLASTPNQLF